MKELARNIIEKIAEEYERDADYLEDVVRDHEDDGIEVDEDWLIDMIENCDL